MEEHKRIYKTKLWQEIRAQVIERDRSICYFCGRIVHKRPTVHHKQELNEENYQDFDIAYGLDNLVCCHADCHNAHHERRGFKSSIVLDDLSIDYSRRKI